MRHLHAADVEFLEAFHDEACAGPTPVNAIAVLSRADEIGAGRLDALRRRAGRQRYRADPRMRGLVQTSCRSPGCWPQAGRALRQDEFAGLRDAGLRVPGRRGALLLSVDRFGVSGPRDVPRCGGPAALLERFGLFGVGWPPRWSARAATARPARGRTGAAQWPDDLRDALASRFTSAATCSRPGRRCRPWTTCCGASRATAGRCGPRSSGSWPAPRVRGAAAAHRDPLVGGGDPRRLPGRGGAAAGCERGGPGAAAGAG